MPIWLATGVIISIHQEQLKRHGGSDGVRDSRGLEGAINRPETIYAYTDGEATLEEQASALAVGLAKGHYFVDGNKRTACVASLLFLRMNGIEIAATEDELATVFEDIAAGKLTEAGLSDWFVQNTVEN